MNWIDFINYICILYPAYYGFNITWDLLMYGKKSAIKGEEDVLHFSEQVETTIIDNSHLQSDQGEKPKKVEKGVAENNAWMENGQETEDIELFAENINMSTGGVHDLAELYRLAQSRAIEVKKNLVF